jgi:RNA polymerase sigma-70 factor (ECF subfamily)
MSRAVLWPVDRAGAGFRARPSVQETAQQRKLVYRAVARAKDGDRDALRFLYVRYSDNVYGYVRSIVHNDHDAEDVTQHVFARLMTVLVKYDERSVPFLGWLLRLAHNAAIDHLRARRTVPAEEVFGCDERADDATLDRSRSLMEALATLPEEQRSVVVLRHLVGLTPGEIASAMGRTESSVHGLHHRGRRALQAELSDRQSAPSIAVAGAAA